MKISYDWLLDFVDLDVVVSGIPAISRALTDLGLTVEAVEKHDEDVIFDLEVTTNRPDCLNHLGVARELAAYFGLKLRVPVMEPPQDQGAMPAKVNILDPESCSRYAARVISGVRIGDAPDWIKSRLEKVGQRPVNNVVDITNLVLFELGQPLHAFDYQRLRGNRIVVREARQGESLETLDGQNRCLEGGMLLICDGEGPTALAGVMGGVFSEVSHATTTILLESACFLPSSIRRTSKRLGLSSEASYRFERVLDPELQVRALNRACRLIEEIAGGSCRGPVIDQHPVPSPAIKVDLTPERLRQVTGIDFPSEFVERTLASLGFGLEPQPDGWHVTVPSFRVDVSLPEDLVEEVLRHYGYDKIESSYPAPSGRGSFLGTEKHDRVLIQILNGAGFSEAISSSFAAPDSEEILWDETPARVPIANPLTEENTHLRGSLLPGLLKTLRHNLNHSNQPVRLFEIGKVFRPGTPEIGEESRLGLIATGTYVQSYWDSLKTPFHFLHLKGVIQSLCDRLGVTIGWKHEATPCFHPGTSSRVMMGSRPLGVAGQLHPKIKEQFKFNDEIFFAELKLDPIYRHPLETPQYQALARFPSVERDLSFLVDKEIEFVKIVDAIKSLNIPDLRDIELVDFYQGPRLPTGKVSQAIRLTFAHPERTLRQEEVNRHSEAVVAVLQTRLGLVVRS